MYCGIREAIHRLLPTESLCAFLIVRHPGVGATAASSTGLELEFFFRPVWSPTSPNSCREYVVDSREWSDGGVGHTRGLELTGTGDRISGGQTPATYPCCSPQALTVMGSSRRLQVQLNPLLPHYLSSFFLCSIVILGLAGLVLGVFISLDCNVINGPAN